MESLGHASFPPTALGRQDNEEVTSGGSSLHLLSFCRSITLASRQFLLLYVGVEIGILTSLPCAYLKGHLTGRTKDWYERNHGSENRNWFDRDNRGFDRNNGWYQFRNRGPSGNFNRGARRHGGRLNSLRVQVDQDDQSQNVRNPPIRLSAICMSPVELPYVPILLNETFTKALWDTGAEKSFISEEVYKKYFFYKPVRKSRAEVVTVQGAKCRNIG
ncbi:uncharacterized protein TNCV_2074951 [Trichonephila clavipes]|nr:uncharacterized protein TNCV_2074951 [Trichonephila clavipes]